MLTTFAVRRDCLYAAGPIAKGKRLMAISPKNTYPGQVDVSDLAGWPEGRARNITVVGDGSGTPLEEQWISDLFGFEQSLLAFAGLTPSGVPDKVGASQYMDALALVIDQHQFNNL